MRVELIGTYEASVAIANFTHPTVVKLKFIFYNTERNVLDKDAHMFFFETLHIIVIVSCQPN